ncbi:hypothetical protein B9T31_11800 [Acinetobacter sp. ANC 4558]|uniref:GTPase n=1 Tax=Acinetobacter sp. ANC 4558 TaxID=1977876 RepID=UPI000A33C5F0|nr:GTPase [Acinetobacter sp. ANC 4558]OTG85473.1 hypothetical protein B9T31_11800 [Acinetobacter sp. ANC 4558]
MDTQNFNEAVAIVLGVLPTRAIDLARLTAIAQSMQTPTITVIGKYNHGKSRLLNELIGHDIFSVADRRETVELTEHVHQNIRWLDAPGLDADVMGQDDHLAQQALWCKSDIRLFVHSVKEGELDSAEHPLLQKLYEDSQRTQRKTLVTLTQVDQVPDQTVLSHIIQSITQQIPQLALLPVSATRHRQAIENNKQLLLQKSGINELRAALDNALSQVPKARLFEKELLFNEMSQQLQALYTERHNELLTLQETQKQQRISFDQDLNTVLDKVRDDLRPTIQVTGHDDALVPDSFENMFKMTAGKQERARIQVAYSRACIDLNSHLVRYGVVGLPSSQQTNVRSLDTVMVAVMGVSVKYREDLRKIFCEDSGRERLCREFAHYYELSAERETLVQKIIDVSAEEALICQAQDALRILEAA